MITRSLILIALMLLASGVASACMCTVMPEKTFRIAKVIFQGTVISIGPEMDKLKFDAPRLRSVTLSVEKKWKGTAKDTITLATNYPGPCSAFEFKEGHTYLVYAALAYGGRILFATSDCNTSKEKNSDIANQDIKRLSSFWFRLKARTWHL